ncbi:MAG TPA: Fe-S cluster assembly ATPase SufC [Leptospiraceae bacterium]|jgi:Fe-S cluster assembly ATP-binding protein|nr:Fe-S cluster assembly ATPase SufC [Leptospirales bacterium]HMU82946.1 Fe-S cluster assembly ATPase SufC [Leptospiraceae bacterium]HMX57473.1 Fe-S cluster assembly ATPase SufC [Leptospiraceae bacterium]HMY44182.1 Fe-S cluster assembly ATPase SufC [Leptospiraceae bacterium]HMZ37582.1 Fe-S cluster assembly ATPase SufC [Leptospiraceae bacterium]
MLLEIKGLEASIEGKEILKGVNLSIPPGEIHAIMGPNGSGKSTLSYVLMGHPKYTITGGDILLDGKSVLAMKPDERARAGMFLCFQYPTSIPGVTMPNYLRNVLKNIRGADVPIKEFRKEVQDSMRNLSMREDFLKRYVNDGFSGGEKKRNEILQMALMKPRVAILDEVDSGLDIDALRIIAENLQAMRSPDRSMLLITHYQRILNYLTLDKVHVFAEGRIITSGGRELAERLEKEGYEAVIKANK